MRLSASPKLLAARRLANHTCLWFALLALTSVGFGQQGSIRGTVIDSSGASIAGAEVRLSLDGRAPDQETKSVDSGEFSFADVAAGSYRLSFSAAGFAVKTISGELPAGQTLSLPPTALDIDSISTAVTVTQTHAEIAQEQIKVEEQQRLLGVIPNFFTSFDPDVVPLNTKQKFELTGKSWLDPAAFVINGMVAGAWQHQNVRKEFGQGVQGYAKRYGASLADHGTGLLLEKTVMTTIFKQDPRYFYKGTGSYGSRALYAASRTLICRGDNKKNQLCYSSLLSRFAAGFITNYYYPAVDREKPGVILQNSASGIGFEALGFLFKEFASKKITFKRH